MLFDETWPGFRGDANMTKHMLIATRGFVSFQRRRLVCVEDRPQHSHMKAKSTCAYTVDICDQT